MEWNWISNFTKLHCESCTVVALIRLLYMQISATIFFWQQCRCWWNIILFCNNVFHCNLWQTWQWPFVPSCYNPVSRISTLRDEKKTELIYLVRKILYKNYGSVTFAGKKLDPFRPHPMLFYRPPLIGRLLLSLYCHWSSVIWPPVIWWALAMNHRFLQWLATPHQWVIPPSQGYIIVHGLCYRPQNYIIVHMAMLSSTGLCYRPQGYVMVQRAMLSSTNLTFLALLTIT